MKGIDIGVIGSNSMVGIQACQQWQELGIKLKKSDLQGPTRVDITDKKSIEDFLKSPRFNWIVLFSAMTDVNAAQKERGNQKGACWQINVEGTKNVALTCRQLDKKLVFISTDFVFDGTGGPYREENSVGPDLDKVSWYGITKIEGEKIVASTCTNFIILRIAYPYSGRSESEVGKEDLVRRVWNLFVKGELYAMYTDQIITPTYIPDIAPAIIHLIGNDQSGIYHLASPIPTSQHEFAKGAIEAIGKDSSKVRTNTLAKELKNQKVGPRPLKGGLKVDKIMACGYNPTDWRSGIEKSATNWLK